jgi:hypothetical protein
VSRTVYEQVSSKLSVGFADIGEQQVKNIPKPVHAYVVALNAVGDLKLKKGRKRIASTLVATAALACVAGLAVVAYTYFTPAVEPTPAKVDPNSPSPAASQAVVPLTPAQPTTPASQSTPPTVPAPVQNAAPASKSIPPALKLSDPTKVDCSARTAGARMFATEPPRGQGALGFKEKAYVNDGQCPAGYIKEITGGGRGTSRGVRCVQC